LDYSFNLSENGEAKLGTTVGVLHAALRQTIERMAAEHGGTTGTWFDDLEADLIRNAKATIGEGVSIEVEAELIQFAVDFLAATISVTRASLQEAPQ